MGRVGMSDLTEQVARWLRDWDTDFAPGHPLWEELDEANRAVYLTGARELLAIAALDGDGQLQSRTWAIPDLSGPEPCDHVRRTCEEVGCPAPTERDGR
jgi:hypothetical protein